MNETYFLNMGICPDNHNHRVIRYLHPETQEIGYRCDGCDTWYGPMGYDSWCRHTGFTKTINDHWRAVKMKKD